MSQHTQEKIAQQIWKLMNKANVFQSQFDQATSFVFTFFLMWTPAFEKVLYFIESYFPVT